MDVLLWIFNAEECSCRGYSFIFCLNHFFFFFQLKANHLFPGGSFMNAWEWIPGIWHAGVPRRLEWRKAEKKSVYEFKDSLSFMLLADWILERFNFLPFFESKSFPKNFS